MADWDARYREGVHEGPRDPHELLTRFEPLIPQGMVIDVASGTGTDIIFLSGKGHPVCGLDRSGEGLGIARENSGREGKSIHLVQGDALALPFREGSASGVIVFNFLQREIMGEIVNLLQKGGILIYETLLKRQNRIEWWGNPDYLLEDGELLDWFIALDLLFYEEKIISFEGKKRVVARYAGRRK